MGEKMKLLSIMWSSYIPLLRDAAVKTGLFRLTAYSTKQINLDSSLVERIGREMRNADLILIYKTEDAFWTAIEDEIHALGGRVPVVVVGSSPSFGQLSTVNPEVLGLVYKYILYSGPENYEEMLKYLSSAIFSGGPPFKLPVETAWEGIYHPDFDSPFLTTADFLEFYPFKGRPLVALLFSRSNWLSGNLQLERSIIRELEGRGIGALPVFYYSIKDKRLGNLSGEEVIGKYLTDGAGIPLVDAIIKLSVFFLGQTSGNMSESQADSGSRLLSRLGVPVFGPVISYYKDRESWLKDPRGLGPQIAWSVALPEFEGVIEPVMIGATSGISRPEEEMYEPVEDRVERLCSRIARWIGLRRKPNHEKRIAFILHNNPCASVEATVGAGAHLDTLESVAHILQRMKKEGYAVDPPATGKALIDDILSRKAISEFRWTTTDEIVSKGGTLAQIDTEQYTGWFDELPASTRDRMIGAWGHPPGEERDGVPAAMVHDGKILVTGVRYGNAVVCVQPKRGCAGARCDGQVCKILHDPDVPPPHQYIATYKWLSRDFKTDVIVHVGTHGNLEFLPGKGSGLSSGCFPDIGIDEMPHLYIYNADNPPEGTLAKRRSYGTLIDHMQTIMVRGELYGDLDEIERLLFEYDKAKEIEPAKAHTISHMIEQKLKEGNLISMVDAPEGAPFDAIARATHEALALLKNTYIPKGMHVFGKIPDGRRLSDFVYAIVRYETTPDSLRGLVRELIEKNCGICGLDPVVLKDMVEEKARGACVGYLDSGTPLAESLARLGPGIACHESLIAELQAKIDAVRQDVLLSDEIGALFKGAGGGYIPPGPSGIVTRGRADILPTGRNFYSLDPKRIPSRVGWEVGIQLARKTLEKYIEDEGEYPENIAFYWQCTDIMWSDGEGMAQMLYLLGVKPRWHSNGRVDGFEIIPPEELGRPRIDITVRVSGITRDNFPSSIELVDEAVQAVAQLDEPPENNYVKKHVIDNMGHSDVPRDDPDSFRRATYRLFASMPGVYQAGTQLAVYASAWKDEKDLSDVFLYWNGYAYGKGVFGEPAHQSFADSLRTVRLSFSKTVTDEYDLLGCCCHFGTHGGMVNAAQVVSGRQIRSYYGDTREQGEVQVRDLANEIRRIVKTKLLNPRWIEGMKEHGYKGAAEISKRIGRVYGWEATTREVDDWVFDDIARTFLMNEENRSFFEEHNPYALEEAARRLIEAAERGLWKPAPDVLDSLKQVYIEIEGWIEEKTSEVEGDFQGGSIDIFTAREVEGWKTKMQDILGRKVER